MKRHAVACGRAQIQQHPHHCSTGYHPLQEKTKLPPPEKLNEILRDQMKMVRKLNYLTNYLAVQDMKCVSSNTLWKEQVEYWELKLAENQEISWWSAVVVELLLRKACIYPELWDL